MGGNSGLCGAHPQEYPKPSQVRTAGRKGLVRCLKGGNLSWHGVVLLAVMAEGGLGAQPGVAVPTHWEGMEGASARLSSAAEALHLDHEVGSWSPAPVLKGAGTQRTLLTGVHGY